MSDTSDIGTCWVGAARYARPLNPTHAQKWRLLSGLKAGRWVVAFSTSARPRAFTQEDTQFRLIPLLPVAPLRYALFGLVAPWLVLWLILRHNVRVLVAQSPYEGAVAAGVTLIARLFGRRVALIIENHGDFAESLFLQRTVPLPGLTRWLMRGLSGFALGRADVLRAVSGFTAAQVSARRPDLPLVQFIAYTDPQVFAQAGAARRTQPSASQMFAFVGTLIPRKGLHVLLEAFAHLDGEPTLSLIGKAENADYAEALHAQCAHLGIAERVQFIAHLPQAEVATQLSEARALVLPSLSEGLGLVVVEAMLCGLPVIGSDTGGIPDMVTPGETGWLVPPDDVETLATTLQTVLADGAAVDRLGAQARAFALQFTDPARFIEGHQTMLKHALVALNRKG